MELKVAFLNCRSHGDCAVITFEDKGEPACIVVDGGEDKNSAQALSDYLKSQNVTMIDLMVGTHIDSDHINGLKTFVQSQLKNKKANKPFVGIKEFWGPMPSEGFVSDLKPTSTANAGVSGAAISWQEFVIQSVEQNDDLFSAVQALGAKILHPAVDNKPTVPFTSIKIELLGPDTQISADHIKAKALGVLPSSEGAGSISTLEDLQNAVTAGFETLAIEANRDANNQSIVFRLSPAIGGTKAKEWTFLFTGDAEEEAWEEMCSNNKIASSLKARVLKVPHHGSALNGITDDGAEKVKPKYSIISVGQKHGLPDKETLTRIIGTGSKTLCTQRNQAIYKNKKSACYSVKAADCPAKDNPDDIIFTLDTDTGNCTMSPKSRACKHSW